MRIPTGIILIWPGTNSSIPSGWIRETSLDGKYPKGWGSQNPNLVGGSDSHYHTTQPHTHQIINHNHSYTVPYVNFYNGESAWDNNTVIVEHRHNHTGYTGDVIDNNYFGSTAFNTGSFSNDPSFKKVIFIKAGLTSLLQNGIIALWGGWQGNNNPPPNWQECNGNNNSPDLRNKYIKGAGTGEDAGGEGGSYYNSHTLNHGHTGASHRHAGHTTGGASGYRVSANGNVNGGHRKNHTHTYGPTDFTTVTPNDYSYTYNTTNVVEPAYKKVMAIQFKTGAIKEKGIIGLWLGNTNNIPKGWVLCDGNNNTPDLRDKFIKIANNSSEIGQTGGSNTHTHNDILHYHSIPSHSHYQNESKDHSTAPKDEAVGSGLADPLWNWGVHSAFWVDEYSSATTTNGLIVFNSADNQPPYRTVAYIQFQKETNTGALLSFFTKILE